MKRVVLRAGPRVFYGIYAFGRCGTRHSGVHETGYLLCSLVGTCRTLAPTDASSATERRAALVPREFV